MIDSSSSIVLFLKFAKNLKKMFKLKTKKNSFSFNLVNKLLFFFIATLLNLKVFIVFLTFIYS